MSSSEVARPKNASGYYFACLRYTAAPLTTALQRCKHDALSTFESYDARLSACSFL